MIFSICMCCGRSKSEPLAKCNNCGADPSGSDLEMAKSLILSTSITNEDGMPVISEDELVSIGDDIGTGESYDFDPVEIKKLLDEKKVLDESPTIQWGFLLFGFCFLIIPIIAIGVFLSS